MSDVKDLEEQTRPYFAGEHRVTQPGRIKWLLSRAAFPGLMFLSRERSLKLGLTPIDDERVIMALRNVKGRVLDIGCGSNTFVRSYGDGVGVDVFKWEGCDVKIDDAAKLPFPDESFDTVSYLACINHIPNREDSAEDAFRVLKPGGTLMMTMIPPTLGRFVHWLRERNDPDHKERCIDHDHELMGMSEDQLRKIAEGAGFTDFRRQPFVFGVRMKNFAFGLNNLYLATKPIKL